MSRRTHLVTRREFLRLSAVASGMALLTACVAPTAPAATSSQSGAAAAGTTPAAETKGLIFVGWNDQAWYDPVVQQFVKENPDVQASYRMLSDYKDEITLLTAGEQCDVLVTRDDDLSGFVQAGFIRSIQDEKGVSELTDDMYPANLAAMTQEDKLYGLPYYTDFHTLMYNNDLLTKAGFDKPPATLSELTDMCVEIKKQGIAEYPLAMWINQEQNFKEIMYSLVYASGGDWFDDNLTPICDKPDSVVQQILDWMADAINNKKIMDKANLEMDDTTGVDPLFQNGKTVFQGLNRYDLRRLNDPSQTPVAKEGERVFRPMLMPGFEGAGKGVVAWTRQYTVNAKAIDQDMAYRLQYFAGGKNKAGDYWTAKQWFDRFGLGFAYKSLATDPDLVKAESVWGDSALFAQQKATAKARKGLGAAWYSEWDNDMQADWHKALLGQSTSAEATKAMADKWNELKAAAA